MSEPQEILGLGLTRSEPTNPAEQIPAETLQFKKAEHTEDERPAQTCAGCKRSFAAPYFHVNGRTVCPECARQIEAGQQAHPAHFLLKAFLYGLGAAVAGSALYAAVAIITGLELALIAILIGFMVGKAIRHACKGLGGRPQQIMAVLLTYFAITTSYIPVVLHHAMTQPKAAVQSGVQSTTTESTTDATSDAPAKQKPSLSAGQAIVTLLILALGAPFMSLTNMSGLLSLLIIFFGLQRAWRMTGRTELLVTGPYGT